MFGFAISLRSKKVSGNWETVVDNLAGTLHSVLNQSSPDFRAVVGCHEVPESLEGIDPRVSFLPINHPTPIYKDEWVVDKQRKREAGTIALFEQGCQYIMPLDADDLVSNRLVEFVLRDRADHGYLIDRGYEYSFSTDRFFYCPNFSRICGSCGIFHWKEGDLPSTPWEEGQFTYRDQVNTVHPNWESRGKQVGRPLQHVPFPAATYVLDTGHNISVLKGNVSRRRDIVRKLMPAVRKDGPLREEFGLNFVPESSKVHA